MEFDTINTFSKYKGVRYMYYHYELNLGYLTLSKKVLYLFSELCSFLFSCRLHNVSSFTVEKIKTVKL